MHKIPIPDDCLFPARRLELSDEWCSTWLGAHLFPGIITCLMIANEVYQIDKITKERDMGSYP